MMKLPLSSFIDWLRKSLMPKSQPIYSLTILVFAEIFLFFTHLQPLYADELGALQPNRPRIDRIIIFGDSISDTGLLPKITFGLLPSKRNYWQGRFSDGFLWDDYLAQSYNTTIMDTDFVRNESIAGATTFPYWIESKKNLFFDSLHIYANLKDPLNSLARLFSLKTYDLKGIITSYESRSPFKATDLVILWMGANDMLWVAEAVAPKLSQEMVAYQAATKIGESLKYLLERGAQNIIVVSMMDMDLAPRFSKSPHKSEQMRYFNSLLQEAVTDQKNDTNNLYYIDMDAFTKNFLKKYYRELGFLNYTDTSTGKTFYSMCPDIRPPALAGYLDFGIYHGANNTHTYWDDVHPTTRVHSFFSAFFKKQYIEKYFEVMPPKEKCNYVEVKNSGYYLLYVEPREKNGKCGTVAKTIPYGETALFSVQDNSDLQLKAIAGRSTLMRISNRTNIIYQENPTGLTSMVPVLHRINCSGTSLIGFNCDKIEK